MRRALTTQTLNSSVGFSFSEFSVRASVALAILEFVDELESVFRQPMHLCDVKASHFGIAGDAKIKFLDLDAVFQKSILGKFEPFPLFPLLSLGRFLKMELRRSSKFEVSSFAQDVKQIKITERTYLELLLN
jgi:hypothetical protein